MRSAIFFSAILLSDAVVFHRTGALKGEWPADRAAVVITMALMIFFGMDVVELFLR